MLKYCTIVILSFWASVTFAQSSKGKLTSVDMLRAADSSLDVILKKYGSKNTFLLRENFPVDERYKADYLGNGASGKQEYAYLWPYSGGLSATVALYEQTKSKKYKSIIDKRLVPGLEEYYDDKRKPAGYASYISSAPVSDRFYDDNIWIGIDFTNLYLLTGETKYLEKATVVWDFVYSGHDDLLGGGIYWCEQKKTSKNTCSNAPAAVFALKLYEATKEKKYLELGKSLYEWTKTNLRDVDGVYMDNIRLDGSIDRTKYPYNSGQMIEAAALLYKITKKPHYLEEAQKVANASFRHFFETDGSQRLKNSDNWFIAVMMRGFVQLYKLDNNPAYLRAFHKNLDFAWTANRDENGLFYKDWKGEKKNERKWLLDQFAIVEMCANIVTLKL
ncbi:glycoside hydrolase family 76 protein [Sphingobacterium gobiense]|uniref:Alpha-1,6-mannanase n=1 Tax=Sphingobacterium gobiense TaxID=1382456 RepID=A0A2S9JR89_9SPHI|nr:glycoside hydrolase family 76 protein [Sphingobacterium gobiense]PRD55760.1 alpha-1,6-mannanase [Sphingobacterium gobiense]